MVRETEAEAVAFVVAEGIGLKADQSASYIQIYHGDAKLLQESLEVVQQTAAVIPRGTSPRASPRGFILSLRLADDFVSSGELFGHAQT
jgi:hypothetical protein